MFFILFLKVYVAIGWILSTGFALSAIFANYTNFGIDANGNRKNFSTFFLTHLV
jgi:hypothetical protein